MALLNEREIREFSRELYADTVNRASGGVAGDGEADFKVNVFTRMVVDYLTDAGIAEEGEVCYFEKKLPANKGIVRANGYFISEEADRVDLFYTVYTGADGSALENLTMTDIKEALERSTRLFAYARNGEFLDVEESTDAFSMLSAMHDAGATIQKARVFLLTDKAVSAKVQDQLQKELRSRQRASKTGFGHRVELVDITRLYRLVKRGAERDPISIDLTSFVAGGLPCLESPKANDAYACYLAVIPGGLLYELYEEYGARLLQLNVRSYLQLRGKVNKGIRQTLMTEPSMFLPYNNGISATAERVELGTDSGGRSVIKSIRGLQIVNGGQTMASIHRAHKADAADIDDVYVQAKISVVTDRRELEFEELVSRISLYANSQNRVSMADFSSNDPFHVELDKLARETYVPGERSRWFYERARGSYQVMKSKYATTPARTREYEGSLPASQVFSKTDATKYLAAWDQLPYLIGRGGQKNFVEYMAIIKAENPKKWVPDVAFYKDLIAKAILFRTMEKIAKDEQFPGYRAQVVAYTVSLVANRYGGKLNLIGIWARQAISPELTDVMRAWCHTVFDEIRESAGERNVAEWCKREGCWQHISSLILPIQDDLPEFGADTVGHASSSDADVSASAEAAEAAETARVLLAVGEVMSYPAEAWRLMAEWGSGTKSLTDAQVKLCYALVRRADEHWEKVPTPVQAKKALLILRTVRSRTEILAMYDE